MYKMVQTIGNKIAGGANGGLFKTEKVCMEFLVSNPAKIPVKTGRIMEESNFFVFGADRKVFRFIMMSFRIP